MKTEQRQPWSIHLQAKAKNLEFKFKATKYLPTFCKFSLFLKISHLLIRVNSDNNQTSRPKALKSKIVQVINKFRPRPTKRQAFAAKKPSRIKRSNWVSFQGPIGGITLVIGNLALWIKSISEKDTKGIIAHVLSILLSILTQLKTFIGTKKNKLLLVLIFIAMVTSLSSYGKRSFASRYIRKILNWAAWRGFLHAVAQIMSKKLNTTGWLERLIFTPYIVYGCCYGRL